MILAASLGGTPRDVSVCLLHVHYPSGSCYFGFHPLQPAPSFPAPQAELTSRVVPQHGLGTEQMCDVLTTGWLVQNCSSSWNPRVLCSLMGFHDKRRARGAGLPLRNVGFALVAAHTLFLLPKGTRSRRSHGVWKQKKSRQCMFHM